MLIRNSKHRAGWLVPYPIKLKLLQHYFRWDVKCWFKKQMLTAQYLFACLGWERHENGKIWFCDLPVIRISIPVITLLLEIPSKEEGDFGLMRVSNKGQGKMFNGSEVEGHKRCKTNNQFCWWLKKIFFIFSALKPCWNSISKIEFFNFFWIKVCFYLFLLSSNLLL